jgi:hypothetical protein
VEDIKNFEIAEDLRQSPEYGRYMKHLGWRVEKLGTEQIFVRKLGPVAIAKLQRNKNVPDQVQLNEVLKKYKVMMCKVEPLVGKQLGYPVSSWPLLGTKTLRVNLRPSEDEIFRSFKKDCRYILRKLQITNYKLQKNQFDEFYEIWKASAKRKKLWIPPVKDYWALVKAFGDKCFCMTIENQAGALVITHKKTAFYYYAGATGDGTRLDYPYLLVWEAMKEAKKRGCVVWDFEGIFDKRWPNKGWVGFSHFKKSFGGSEWEFTGSFEKWRWPF